MFTKAINLATFTALSTVGQTTAVDKSTKLRTTQQESIDIVKGFGGPAEQYSTACLSPAEWGHMHALRSIIVHGNHASH